MATTYVISGGAGSASYAVESVSFLVETGDVTVFTLTTSEYVPASVFDNGRFTIEAIENGSVVGTITGSEDYSYNGFAGPNGTVIYQFSAQTSSIVATPSFGFPCFAAGTRIGTPSGEISVEALREGDVVTLATGGEAAVAWIGHRRARDAEIVRFRAGSLPVGPARDLVVSPDHAMFLDGSLVPAALLVDGEAVTRETCAEIVFYHVELAAHGVLLADGAPAESYFDSGNRQKFSNCALGYDPARPDREPCAEMVLAGTRLAQLRALVRTPAPA